MASTLWLFMGVVAMPFLAFGGFYSFISIWCGSKTQINIFFWFCISVETEFAEKAKQMEERHKKELSEMEGADGAAEVKTEEATQTAMAETNDAVESTPAESGLSKEEEERQRKMEKARRKREKQKEKERRREEDIAAETAAAGPTPRDIENSQLLATLAPLNMTIQDVPADGNCLYRAVAAQLNASQQLSSPNGFVEVRGICADSLEKNSEEFSPFVEYTETAPDFSSYVQRVRSSADWGGHLELRAISMATERPIHVYSASSSTAMIIEGGNNQQKDNPIRLSYHLHYYALGEHYNQVVPLSS
mmetsp:Transcript_25092/g.52168  ORF Transcript_25092/g.52168 Transcript_25092/m.52168 type:complete len:305 (+) Transcript_25092:150-1064(+)